MSGQEEVDHLSSTHAELVTRRLAERTREQFESDFALAVGPITQAREPSDDRVLWLGLAHGGETTCRPTNYVGHPDILQERAAKQALNLLRKYLLNLQRDCA
jgi:nicotinamide mononucleotide (NMN) deamidase PncC